MPAAFLALPSSTPSPLFEAADYTRQRAFFAARPDLLATPLRSLPRLARQLGLDALLVKDETARFGLNAFKAVGALFALTTLREEGALSPGETLVCASEGNHGRAVARAARALGCHARVYMADSVAAARVRAIEAEGASVVPVAGTYDDAVRTMSNEARTFGWRVISDTSADGDDETVPRRIMLGYTRLMDEAEDAWQPGPPPDLLVLPGGVGGLLAAVASWAHVRFGADRPRIVAVEPMSAACLQAAARAGRPVSLPGPFETAMGGLRCGEVSRAAFGAVQSLVDAYVAIEDEWAFEAMRLLAGTADRDTGRSAPDPAARPEDRLETGVSGAAALGGVVALVRHPALADAARALLARGHSRTLVVATEGVTEPDLFARVAARPTSGHRRGEAAEPQ